MTVLYVSVHARQSFFDYNLKFFCRHHRTKRDDGGLAAKATKPNRIFLDLRQNFRGCFTGNLAGT